jgi:hypothetical protein
MLLLEIKFFYKLLILLFFIGVAVILIIPKYYKVMRSRIEIEKLLYIEGKIEKKFYTEIKIFKVLGAGSKNNTIIDIVVLIMINIIEKYEINSIFFIKLINVFKKNIKYDKMNKFKNYNINNNKHYSTRIELTKEYYKQKKNQLKKMDDNFFDGKRNLHKTFENKFNHPVTVEKGKNIGEDKIELLFITETTTNKSIIDFNNKVIEVIEFKEDKYIPKIILKDIIYKTDLLSGKICKEDDKFRFNIEDENKKIDILNELIDTNNIQEFDMFNIGKSNMQPYNGVIWNKYESFKDFIDKF